MPLQAWDRTDQARVLFRQFPNQSYFLTLHSNSFLLAILILILNLHAILWPICATNNRPPLYDPYCSVTKLLHSPQFLSVHCYLVYQPSTTLKDTLNLLSTPDRLSAGITCGRFILLLFLLSQFNQVDCQILRGAKITVPVLFPDGREQSVQRRLHGYLGHRMAFLGLCYVYTLISKALD